MRTEEDNYKLPTYELHMSRRLAGTLKNRKEKALRKAVTKCNDPLRRAGANNRLGIQIWIYRLQCQLCRVQAIA
jgi:hypothetical protein